MRNVFLSPEKEYTSNQLSQLQICHSNAVVHHVSRQSAVIYRAEEVKGIVWQIIKISSQTNFEWLAESLLHLNHQLKGQFELQHFSNKSGLMRGGKKRHVARATQRVRQCRCRPQIGLVQVLQRCYVICWVTPAYRVHQHLQFHVSTLMRDKPFSFIVHLMV